MSERQQGGVGHGGSLNEITAAGCFLGPELRLGPRAGGGQSATGDRHLYGWAGTDQVVYDNVKCRGICVGGTMWWPGMVECRLLLDTGDAEQVQQGVVGTAEVRAEGRCGFKTEMGGSMGSTGGAGEGGQCTETGCAGPGQQDGADPGRSLCGLC